jgi:hypothetical protein
MRRRYPPEARREVADIAARHVSPAARASFIERYKLAVGPAVRWFGSGLVVKGLASTRSVFCGPTNGNALPDLRVAIIDSDLGTGGAITSGKLWPQCQQWPKCPTATTASFRMINATTCGVTDPMPSGLNTRQDSPSIIPATSMPYLRVWLAASELTAAGSNTSCKPLSLLFALA